MAAGELSCVKDVVMCTYVHVYRYLIPNCIFIVYVYAGKAYTETLRKYHNWVVRGIFQVGRPFEFVHMPGKNKGVQLWCHFTHDATSLTHDASFLTHDAILCFS